MEFFADAFYEWPSSNVMWVVIACAFLTHFLYKYHIRKANLQTFRHMLINIRKPNLPASNHKLHRKEIQKLMFTANSHCSRARHLDYCTSELPLVGQLPGWLCLFTLQTHGNLLHCILIRLEITRLRSYSIKLKCFFDHFFHIIITKGLIMCKTGWMSFR